MNSSCLRFLSCALLPVALFSVSGVEAGDHTVFFHSLSHDDQFEMVDPDQRREFEPGPTPGSEALCLKPTESSKAGLVFYVDTTVLDEGTVEISINPHQETEASNALITILNLGSAGNTKCRISMRNSRIEAIFPVGGGRGIRLKSDPIEIGTWHHVALTWSPQSGVKLFVDGVCVGLERGSATLWQHTKKEHLYVGFTPPLPKENGEAKPSTHYVGCVSSLRISDVAIDDFPQP